ncbi:membrane-bound lytic murein transglycosylase F [Andreprevotia lacus DSM 23236]|jgi:membrane-bound lytic murein transglycosylase F|uniref:Membrane-bound lytic murein transglycosylase F n=1 Tax=Andreprevotia lacus DSM 23236 TaxID=1121001 RepID=A0A1W1XZB9_9NEIS|nr:membrane-bound lytic murein transglycosylase MltF [Andreprevotia lacus]SMC29225.1 membrane-bound lytic murein transglycosylase F [Andreprevotia lacus DSM 23236]
MAIAAATLVGCGEMPTDASRVLPLAESKELVVLVQNSPTTLYVDAEGSYAGLEYDLVTRFAEQQGLKVRFLVEPNYARVLERLRLHQAHLAVGVHADSEQSGVHFGPAYQSVSAVLLYNNKGQTDEQALARLYAGDAMAKVLPQYLAAMNRAKTAHAGLTWRLVDDMDGEEMVEAVAAGKLDYAVVGSHVADVSSNYYPQVGVVHQMGDAQALAWAVPDAEPELLQRVSGYFAAIQGDGSLAKALDRYYGHVNRVASPDAMAFLQKREETLPRYRNWFQRAETETGLDWRLLASLAYQESHWNPDAVSPYGVRGMMMLTGETAQRMGVDRLNPMQSILGGARYLQLMKDSLPDNIAEPDKTWLALAAYNVGLGHLLDARELARRQNKNPDSWSDVKSTLPLLRNPKYFSTVKYGYARGGEPVIYVETLRNFYDILVRFEAPFKPSLPTVADDVTVQNPGNRDLEINNRVVATRTVAAL